MTSGCPACGQVHTIPPGSEGKLFGCLKCKARMVVRGNRLLPADEPPKTVIPPAAAKPPTTNSFTALTADPPPAPRYVGGGSTVGDYLMFRRLITPFLIVVLFWVGTAGIVGSGLLTMASSVTTTNTILPPAVPPAAPKEKGKVADVPPIDSKTSFSVVTFLSGLATVLLGPIAWRIACESIIVVYRIQEDLAAVRDVQARSPST